MGNIVDRNDYSIGASESAQGNFETVAAMLEATLDRRDADVRAAMSEYQADGVSDQYEHLEQRWNTAGQQVRDIIQQIRNSLSENDDVARRALSQASSAIPG
ncbi:pore-forming ESAT-6 family protein [Kocuria sp.]|uniref:pore-forming ESAT-6 family protein n=1 Tax=Kocuria sp. TaxID=1871328 RepID=UPI0026DF83F5|nr:pore-forming ESAT-6 family protein [Kocuria sp.]MDO5619468.1 pore-forming ESAT-6 family protein [Kocuria sp.]